MLWLAVHFPLLGLEIFQAQVPSAVESTSGQSTSVQPIKDKNTDKKTTDPTACVLLSNNRVLKRNKTAHQVGIEIGSTLATAHSICPNVQHQQQDVEAEQKRLRTLADILYRFSGHVSLQAPDTIVLEIGGSLKLFGCHEKLDHAVIDLCESLGHKVQTRVAKTPWAAIAMSRSGIKKIMDVPLQQAGLELAGINPNIIERFANMGIYTLGPLIKLPAKQLGRRFGKALLSYIAQLTGDLPDPRPAITPRATFLQQIHLLKPLRNKEDLYVHNHSPMWNMVGELQQWLITHQLGCEQLVWKFADFAHEAIYMPVRFATGRQSQHDFMRISELKLAQTDLPSEILTVGLSCRHLCKWQNTSQNLFTGLIAQPSPEYQISNTLYATPNSATTAAKRRGKPRQKQEQESQLYELVDDLNARLGNQACLGMQVIAQHAPEQSWQHITARQLKFGGTHPHPAKIGQKKTNRQAGPPSLNSTSTGLQQITSLHKRPLWLFESPQPIQPQDLELLHGPERIQSAWWQAQTISRDYYIARHNNGSECWAFVDTQQHWYLHGYFG